MSIEPLEVQLAEKILTVTTRILSTKRLVGHLLTTGLPEHVIRLRSDLEGIKINLPYGDIERLRAYRRALGKGWQFQRTWGNADPYYAYKIYEYTNPLYPEVELWLDMTLRPNEAQATDHNGNGNGTAVHCKLVQVGTSLVEQPIFRVVCNGEVA